MHIPFCDSKCYYCAFNSYTDRFHLKKSYMEALIKQLKHELQTNCHNRKLKTVFIGGGTPSTIEASWYKEVFDLLAPYLEKNAEITTEANPNSATKKWQQTMYDLGVNRISFGVQSFDDSKLKKLNRAHNANSAISAIQNAKCIGFKGINCDIIYGVQGDSFELLKRDFDQIKALEIDHLSAYSLTLEEGTKFYRKSEVKIDDEELSYELFDYLKKLGFKQYEISNFATKKEARSTHNFGYWQAEEYLGVGAGAVGFVNNQRYYPQKNIEAYINDPINYELESLSDEDLKIESVLLGLRCALGIEASLLDPTQLEKAKILVQEEKLIFKDKRFYNENFLLADELALFILE